MDVAMRRSDKGREQDAVSFANMDVAMRRPDKGREDAVSFSGLRCSAISLISLPTSTKSRGKAKRLPTFFNNISTRLIVTTLP